jgi:hypothetical protein
MNIYELRNHVDGEIVDFNQLNALLHHYAHPRGRINKWLKTGELIRVKKGLYVFGPVARRSAFNLELLANLIYGPSAISLNYALSYYGLIPEAVYTVTSITNKRNKKFSTPLGDFSYTYLHPAKYAIGIQLKTLANNISFLIASPEKALCDMVALQTKNLNFRCEDDIAAFLFDDLRFDEDAFKSLSMSDMKKIAECYQNPRLNQFINYANLWMKKYG